MLRYEIVDLSDLNFFRSNLALKAVEESARRAGTDALRRMRASSQKEVRKRKNAKVAAVNNRLATVFPPKFVRIREMEWMLKVSNKPIGLSDYKARQNKKGVVLSVNVGSTKLLKSAFIRNLRGRRQVLSLQDWEDGKGEKLRRLVSSSIKDRFMDDSFIDDQLVLGRSVFAKAFERNMNAIQTKRISKI